MKWKSIIIINTGLKVFLISGVRRLAAGGEKNPIFKKKKIFIIWEFMSASANAMMGTQLSHSQTNIISQSEVEWGRS